MKKFIAILLIVITLLPCSICLTGCDGGSDGGRCKYCGTRTNWTYRGGGYICYSCDH